MIARRKDARRRRGWLRVPPSCIERACIIFQKGAREKYPRYSGFACCPPEAPSIGNKYPDFPYHRHQHTYCSSSSLSLFFDFFFASILVTSPFENASRIRVSCVFPTTAPAAPLSPPLCACLRHANFHPLAPRYDIYISSSPYELSRRRERERREILAEMTRMTGTGRRRSNTGRSFANTDSE